MATIARISGGTTVSMLEDMVALLKKLNRSVESLQVVDSAQRQKVTIEAGTLPTVSTVSTVSNLGTINGVDPRYQMMDLARASYAVGIRTNLIWS